MRASAQPADSLSASAAARIHTLTIDLLYDQAVKEADWSLVADLLGEFSDTELAERVANLPEKDLEQLKEAIEQRASDPSGHILQFITQRLTASSLP